MEKIKEKISALFLGLGNPEMAEITEESLAYPYLVFGKKYIVEEKEEFFIFYKISSEENVETEDIIGVFSEKQLLLEIGKVYTQDIVDSILKAEK